MSMVATIRSPVRDARTVGPARLTSVNPNEAMAAANQHAGNADKDSSLFSQAFSFISNMNKDDDNIDEDKVQQEHKQAYEKGNAGSMSASAMGRCVFISRLPWSTLMLVPLLCKPSSSLLKVAPLLLPKSLEVTTWSAR